MNDNDDDLHQNDQDYHGFAFGVDDELCDYVDALVVMVYYASLQQEKN